jgi:hypothetical protein
MNHSVDVQRSGFLYICRKYSMVLTGLDKSIIRPEIQKAFTAHQLIKSLREVRQSLVFIAYDPAIFDGAVAMLGTVAERLQNIARTRVILYTPIAISPSQNSHKSRIPYSGFVTHHRTRTWSRYRQS